MSGPFGNNEYFERTKYSIMNETLNGLGQSVTVSLFLLFFVPMVTVLTMRTFPFFDRLKRAEPLLIMVTGYLLTGIVTWALLRSLQQTAIRYLLIYGVAVSVLLVVRMVRNRRPHNDDREPKDPLDSL